jgi:hypothetical protein
MNQELSARMFGPPHRPASAKHQKTIRRKSSSPSRCDEIKDKIQLTGNPITTVGLFLRRTSHETTEKADLAAWLPVQDSA